MVKQLFAGIRHVAQHDLVSAADYRRRAQNVRTVSLTLALLSLSLIAYSLIFEPGSIDPTVLALAAAAFVGAHALARRGHIDWAARAVVAVAIATVAVAVAGRGHFLMLPFYFALPVMAAGAVLRPREVLAASAVTMGLIVILWRQLAGQTVGPPASALLIGPLLVNGAAGMLATFSASTAARALHRAETGVSQAERTEQALRESERYYRLIADNTSDLIALIDARGRFLYASPSYAQSLGHAPVMLVGGFAADLLHPDDRALADADAERARASGAAQGVYRAISRAGEQRWLDMRMTRVHEDGEDYLLVVARDITERRDLETRLLQSQKMEALGRLAGGVAHDFNNLLAVIGGGVDLAAAALPEGHPARADLDEVLDASRRAAGLTRQLLAFARRQVISPRLLDLGEVLTGAARLIERLAGPAVRLTVRVDPDLWPVQADPSQIEQVIMNLAINAHDAMPNGGELRISLANRTLAAGAGRLDLPPGDYVALEVCDTGVGMSGSVQRRIFEPFFTTKGPDRGTGLGLATCYGIVTQSGGTISVSSALGRGTTFTVLLPAAPA